MKKILFLLPLVSLLAIGCLTQNQPQNQNETTNQAPANVANPASVYCEEQGGNVEIRTDANGGQVGFCIFNDGSECEEWIYYRGECDPQSANQDITDMIKQLFVEKYNKSQSEVSVTVTEQTANHARGGVQFGQGGPGEGGYYLAAKVGGEWKLVIDGNGGIPCSLLEDYNFPESMKTGCYEE